MVLQLQILCLVLLTTQVVHAGRPYVNDPDCPRKPEQTGQRKCLKKCLNDGDCRGRSRRCLCDDVCGKSCVRPTSKCAPLNAITNGRFEISPFNTFGAKVRYTCSEGHILTGQAERVCQGDGEWSGEPPTCDTEGKCREPPEVPYASHDGSKGQRVFPLGMQLTYSCESGYDIDGFFRAMCVGEGRWVGPRMTCTPRRCGHPGEVVNGIREGSVFIYPNRVTYTCSKGYELQDGRPYRICQANGQWSGKIPACKPIKCPKPSAPVNGYVLGDDFSYGASVQYKCMEGFNLTGLSTRECQHDGTWEGEDPTCALVDCKTPFIHNGRIHGKQWTFGSRVNFECFSHFTLQGESSVLCEANGRWTPPVPTCVGQCERPVIAHMKDHVHDSSRVNHSQSIVLGNCSEGYTLSSNEPLVCDNGNWNHVPVCVNASCSKVRPADIKDGLVRYYKTDHGDRAKYSCNLGFKLEGDDYVECVRGKWEAKNQEPSCKQVQCDYPIKPGEPELTNGKILIVGSGKYEYRHYVRNINHNDQIEYACNAGYRLEGPTGATCVDGKWSPPFKSSCVPSHYPSFNHVLRGKRQADTPAVNKRVRQIRPRWFHL